MRPRSLGTRLRFDILGAAVVAAGWAGLTYAGAPAWLSWGFLAVTGLGYVGARALMAISDELGRIAMKMQARQPLTAYEARVVQRLHFTPDDPGQLDGTPLA